MGVAEEKKSLAAALEKIEQPKVEQAAKMLIDALKGGKKVLIAGNGGSAADAQHFAAELVCTFDDRGRKGLPAIALTTNTSILTAWSNDFSYDTVFQRQLEALAQPGDVFVSITTSGNSRNLVAAMQKAKELGLKNILLSGKGGGEAVKHADLAIVINAGKTPRIQECHVFCIHEMCAIIDGAFKK